MTNKNIQQVREFNRFYTNIIGLLDNHILESEYSLQEARVLYELYNRQPCSASAILDSIEMDKGYLSRILRNFIKKKMLVKKSDQFDGRASVLCLTAKGEREFNNLNQAAADQLRTLFSRFSSAEVLLLLNHMAAIKKIISKRI